MESEVLKNRNEFNHGETDYSQSICPNGLHLSINTQQKELRMKNTNYKNHITANWP